MTVVHRNDLPFKLGTDDAGIQRVDQTSSRNGANVVKLENKYPFIEPPAPAPAPFQKKVGSWAARVAGLAYAKVSKTLPKNLDEWNYVQVTIRIQALEKAEAERREKEKQAKEQRRKAR